MDEVPELATSGKLEPDDGGMEETQTDSSSKTAKPDKADEELAERKQLDSKTRGVDNICTICDFSAKCPRSLKIHSARRHGKNPKKTDSTAKPAEDGENISDVSPAEVQQEMDMDTESAPEVEQNQESNLGPDLDELRSASSNDGMNKKGLSKEDMEIDKQANQERRVSKRTPKPKIIYSCNYCGQEFRDKSPLDVHIQRYHTKDTPYTCEYLLVCIPGDIQLHLLNRITFLL